MESGCSMEMRCERVGTGKMGAGGMGHGGAGRRPLVSGLACPHNRHTPLPVSPHHMGSGCWMQIGSLDAITLASAQFCMLANYHPPPPPCQWPGPRFFFPKRGAIDRGGGMILHSGWGGHWQRASIGQVWTRHLAPAAPASPPSSPSQFHDCPCHADSALQFVPSLVPGWGKSRAASTGFRALSPSD